MLENMFFSSIKPVVLHRRGVLLRRAEVSQGREGGTSMSSTEIQMISKVRTASVRVQQPPSPPRKIVHQQGVNCARQ